MIVLLCFPSAEWFRLLSEMFDDGRQDPDCPIITPADCYDSNGQPDYDNQRLPCE